MQNNPQVAVMLPVFNGEKTLPLAISSLVHQTYSHWKCYIVNDGSKDGTRKILDGLTDPRFEVIHFTKNKGRPFARQTALDAAEGKYLAFLDADDFYHEKKLELQVEVLEKNAEIYLVGCRMASFDEDYKLITVRSRNGCDVSKTYNYRNELAIAKPCTVIRLKKAKTVNYNVKLKYAEDTDFLSKYLKGEKYLILNAVLYFYGEFGSVTRRKILDTYTYKFIRTSKKFKHYPVWISLSLLKITIARMRMFFILKRKGAEYVLKKRGNMPEQKDIKLFRRSYEKLSKLD